MEKIINGEDNLKDIMRNINKDSNTQADLEIIEDYKSVKQIFRISFIILELEIKI